jgi:lipopolysaccharide transport system ATP-binding protein
MSSNPIAVRVEGLGKRYLMPGKKDAEGASGFKRHLREFLPFLRSDDKDYFWALKDVDFEVSKGEILGVLGLNGSGKSTLLKILSSIVQPTTGRAELYGRVGSLLEVGTGFHPDLTGRENVFMSGALIGLKQAEIRAKFDEIVDFSGIGQFIDVPVKRYSSGMYIRLAYAVASLLDSDILILDEVMAVGDASFREKSERNIQRITNDGRTVLFVSHNIQAIRKICTQGLVLEHGSVTLRGTSEDIALAYMRDVNSPENKIDLLELSPYVDLTDAKGYDGERPLPTFQWLETLNGDGVSTRLFRTGDTLIIRLAYRAPQPTEFTYMTIFFVNDFGDRQMVLYDVHDGEAPKLGQEGVIECRVDDLRLVDGDYTLMIDIGGKSASELRSLDSLDCIPNATRIRVVLGDYLGWFGIRRNQGAFAQRSRWRSAEQSRIPRRKAHADGGGL